MGLIFIPFFLLMSVAGMLIPHQSNSPSAALPVVFGMGFAIAMPIFYAIFGFIFGVVGAWIYNQIAKWLGGIEMEIE